MGHQCVALASRFINSLIDCVNTASHLKMDRSFGVCGLVCALSLVLCSKSPFLPCRSISGQSQYLSIYTLLFSIHLILNRLSPAFGTVKYHPIPLSSSYSGVAGLLGLLAAKCKSILLRMGKLIHSILRDHTFPPGSRLSSNLAVTLFFLSVPRKACRGGKKGRNRKSKQRSQPLSVKTR